MSRQGREGGPGAPGPGESIPVVQEEVVVGRRPVTRGRVRVVRRLVREPREIEVPLTTEHLEIERVAVDQPVAERPAPRWEGDVLIIPRVEEVLVVEKRLRVCEELHVRTVKTQEIYRQTTSVRREEIEIERESTSKASEEQDHEDDRRDVHG